MNDEKRSQPIDFEKYRTTELFEQVVDLVNFGGKLRSVFVSTFLFMLGFSALIGFLLYFASWYDRTVGGWLVGALLLTSIPVGMVGGIAMGIAELIRRSLGNMLQIVDLSLTVTEQVAIDYRQLQSGDKELPPPGVLIQAVYTQVTLPLVESAVSETLGFLGKPVLWAYRISLGRMVRIVINRFVPPSYVSYLPGGEDLVDAEKLAGEVTKTMGQIEANESRIHRTLSWTRGKIVAVGGWLRLLVMLPCYAIFAALLLVLVTPMIVIFILFAKAPEPALETACAMLQCVEWAMV